MRVAIDARELCGRPTGVGRYLSSLLSRWRAGEARRHEFHLFAHQPVGDAPFPTTVVPGGGGTGWEQWRLPRALAQYRPDILFAPAYTAPLAAPCPVVLSVHDMSFAARPEWFSRREGLRRRTVTRWSARRARLVLTLSEFSRGEVLRHLGIARARVRVIPLGMEPRTGSVAEGAREPLVLYVGSIFQRRHVDALIDAFVTTVAPRVPHSRLEIVGDNRLFPPEDLTAALRSCPPAIAARVSLRSYVDDDTLDDLYRRAAVFAFLSEYEGFGLTPLEALAAGVPSVVLETPVAREVYGEAARYVAEPSRAAIANAIVDLLTNARSRAAILAQREAALARYDWDRTAAATLAALEEAAGV